MASTIWDTLRSRDSSGLSTFIASGADVNEVGAGEQTPLHLASELDAKDCVSMLLAAKAQVEAEDGQLRSPLSLACESKAFESAQILIACGASLAATDKNDMTPLHWMACYGYAPGAISLMQLAIAKGAGIDASNYQMQTPLFCAISRGNVDAALVLVDAGASLKIEDETAGTMMHLAMQYVDSAPDEATSLKLLQRLLKAPSGKTDVNSKDREKRTPLHWAAGKNALTCVQALLKAGAEVNARDWTEHTPLHWACPMDALDTVKALVAAGAHVDVVDRDQRTPLHWAAERGAESVVKFLLEETAVKIDATDYGGFTALHSAARRGLLDALKLLLAKGANPNLAALNGETPCDLAVDSDVKRALVPAAEASPSGLKRRRSMSTDNTKLEGELPTLAEALYATIKKGDLTAVRTLCVEAISRKVAGQASGVLAGGVEVGMMHVSARTGSVHVDLTLSGGASAVHKLKFAEDGLISGSDIFTGDA